MEAAARAGAGARSHRAWCEAALLDGAGRAGLKQALQDALDRITRGQKPEAFFKQLCTDGKHSQSVCNKTWKRGSIAYRCLVCEIDPTSAVCPDCFRAGAHAGHNYRIVQSAGCCDCGDDTVWLRTGFCPSHGVPLGPDGRPIYEPRLPDEISQMLCDTLAVVCERLSRDCLIALKFDTSIANIAVERAAEEAVITGAATASFGTVGGSDAAGAPTAGGSDAAGAPTPTRTAGGAGRVSAGRASMLAGAMAGPPDVDARRSPTTSDTERTLLLGARHGELSMVREALKDGASPDAADPNHYCHPTALHWASQYGFLSIARALLDAKASVHSLNVYRQTPLQVAVFEGHLQIVRLLLAHGADPFHSDLIFGTSMHIAEYETTRNRTKTNALLKVAVEARTGAASSCVECEGGEGARQSDENAAIVAAQAKAGRELAHTPSSSPMDTSRMTSALYGPSSGAVALEMVRSILSWLCSLCRHGDSVREAAAGAASSPPLLRVALQLRIACDRPVGLPGGPKGLAVAQPLVEFDELCQSLLLFSSFREELLAETLRLYGPLIGLSTWPSAYLPSSDLTSDKSNRMPVGESEGDTGRNARRAEGASVPSTAAATCAPASAFTSSYASSAAAFAAAIAPADGVVAPTDSMIVDLQAPLGKSVFLESFSTRLFTGRTHTSAAIVERAVPTLLAALRGLLEMTLQPAGVGTLLAKPSQTAKTDLLAIQTNRFTPRMVVDRVLRHGLGFTSPVVSVLHTFEQVDVSPAMTSLDSVVEETVIYEDDAPELKNKASEYNERLDTPIEQLIGRSPTVFRVRDRSSSSRASANTVGEESCMPRLFQIRAVSEPVPADGEPPNGQPPYGGSCYLCLGREVVDGRLLPAAGGRPPLGFVYTSVTEDEEIETDHPPSRTTPELLAAAQAGHLGQVCGRHYVLSSRGYAQTLTDLSHLLSHPENAVQLLVGSGVASFAGSRSGSSGRKQTEDISEGAASGDCDGVHVEGRYFSEALRVLGWVQHMGALTREERDPGAAPREDDDDLSSLVWVHAFCLSVELAALTPSLLVPLLSTTRPEEPHTRRRIAAVALEPEAPDTLGVSVPVGINGAASIAGMALDELKTDDVIRDCAGVAWNKLMGWLASASTASVTNADSMGIARGSPGAACYPSKAIEKDACQPSGTPPRPPAPDSLLPLWPEGGDSLGPPLISHQLPLHRMVATFLHAAIARGGDFRALLPGLDAATAAATLEHPLRLQLLPMQLRMRGWSGSGRSPWAADQFYRGRLHREHGWARDMLLIQACAIVLGPDPFVRRLCVRLPGGAVSATDDSSRTAVEEALWLMILLLKDWALTGEVALRRDLVHQLALGPMPHSVLCRRLERRWAEHPRFAPLLEEIGRRAASAAGGRYSLRTSLWREIDLTYPFYTSEERKQVAHRLHGLCLNSGPGGGHVAQASAISPSLVAASDRGVVTPTPVPKLRVSAGALRYMPQLGSLVLSEPLLRLIALAISAAAAGGSCAEPLQSHSLHLLLYGLQICAEKTHPETGSLSQASMPAEAAAACSNSISDAEARAFLAWLCDGSAFASELAGGFAGALGSPAKKRGDIQESNSSQTAAMGSSCVGRSLVGALVRLTQSSSVAGPCKVAAEHALSIACNISADCEAARAAAMAERQQLDSQSATPGRATADRDERRKAARAGRARMMQRMVAAQAAFAGEGADGSPRENRTPSEMTPSSRARSARREAERRRLAALLGDEDACCVLCKERLTGEEDAASTLSSTGECPVLACGLIARVCTQRLPLPSGVRPRQVAVAEMLARSSRAGDGPESIDASTLRATISAATAADGTESASNPSNDPLRGASKKRMRDNAGTERGPLGGRGDGFRRAVARAVQADAIAERLTGNTTSEALAETDALRHLGGRGPEDSEHSRADESGGTRLRHRVSTQRIAEGSGIHGQRGSLAAAARRQMLSSAEAQMLLEAGIPEEEILAGMGAGDAPHAEEYEADEMGVEDDIEGSGEEDEGESGFEDSDSAVSGEDDGPSSRELRHRRRMRQVMEEQMEHVVEMMIERAAAATGLSTSLTAGVDEAEADGDVDEGAGDDPEGEDADDDDDDVAMDDEDVMSDDEAALGYRSDLLRESEAQLLQLLHGEIDDGGLATGGAPPDSHLTMLMNETESDFGSDSEEEDELAVDDDTDADVAGESGLSPGSGAGGAAATGRAVRATIGWPLPQLSSAKGLATRLRVGTIGGDAGALRREGSLLSRSSPGPLVSTCGHATHVSCWHDYMTGLLRRVMQSEGFEGEGLVKPQRGEFVCPVCRRAANALMPLAPCEPEDAELPAEPRGKAKGRVRNASDEIRIWARRMLRNRDKVAKPPQTDEGSVSKELLSTIEHFSITCTTIHGALPRLSTPPDDARVRLMPTALLAHNTAVAELSCRMAAHGAGPTGAEAAATSLKLRTLWQLARASQPQVASTTAVLLGCLCEDAEQLTASSAKAKSGVDPLVTDVAISALLCTDPFILFVDLLVVNGVSHSHLAAACAIAAAIVQSITAAAAVMLGTESASGEEWARHLVLLRQQLAELGSATKGVGETDIRDLLGSYCGELLWRMRHLVEVLREPQAGGATVTTSPRDSGEGNMSMKGAPEGGSSRDAIAYCLETLGLSRGAEPSALFLPLALDMLDAVIAVAPTVWSHGSAAFVATGFSASTITSTRQAQPDRRLLATLVGWPPLPPPAVGLISLPSSFEAAFHDASHRRCTLCHAAPDSRAVCLVCHAPLCGLDTPHGARAIQTHAATCGAGAGLFLLTCNSAVVLVRERRLHFVGSPYRDEHGEVDIGLVRGKPLTLHAAEFATLTKHWLNLSFDETARSDEEQLPMGL